MTRVVTAKWRIAGTVAGGAIGVCVAYCIALILIGFGVFGVKVPGPLGEHGEQIVSICLIAVCTATGVAVGYGIGRRHDVKPLKVVGTTTKDPTARHA